MSKTLLIGLDGATWDIIKPMLSQGRLPNIGRLVREGVSGNLESVNPPISAPAWVSFMTGKNPGKHGVTHFLWMPKNPYIKKPSQNSQLINSTLIRQSNVTLFDILSVEGKKVGVVNLPCTYPAWEVNGFMVSGFLTPESAESFTFPTSLSKEIVENIEGYKIDLKFELKLNKKNQRVIKGNEVHVRSQDLTEIVRDRIRGFASLSREKRGLLVGLYEITEIRTETIFYLMERYRDLDFLLLYFRELDVLSHFFWDERAVIEDYYSVLDEKLGLILSRYSEGDYVFLISDHGFGPIERYEFNLNYLLYERNLLFIKRDVERSKLYRFRQFSKRHLRFIRRLISQRVRKQIALKSSFPQVDWTRTIAYGKSHSALVGININLKGREEFGIVERGDYERTRERIINELKDVVDPLNGNKIFQAVKKREEMYTGDYLEKIPDIVIITRPEYRTRLLFSNEIITVKDIPGERTGSHRKEYKGIFIAKGPGTKSGVFIHGAKLIDMMPTILFAMDCPIDVDVDGRVVKELFQENSYLSSKKPSYKKYEPKSCVDINAYSLEEGTDEIKQQLRALGYLD